MLRFAASIAFLVLLSGLAENSPAQAAETAQASGAVRDSGSTSQETGKPVSKQDQPAACYQCHADVQAAFAEPVHHKVNEGQMQCSDCHEAHGANGKKDKRAAADWNAVCTKCHTQTAGPFVHEHPVVQTEGCVSCHAPHGSANAHLLTESNVNTLCLQCHSATNASAFPHAVSAAASAHDPATQPAACTSCHTQIHGSNASDIFFQ